MNGASSLCPVCRVIAYVPRHLRNADEWIGYRRYLKPTHEHEFVCGHRLSDELVRSS